MIDTFYGQSCVAAATAGKSLLFDAFVRPDEPARDVDVSALRPDGFLTFGPYDPVADAFELAGRAGGAMTVHPAVRPSRGVRR